MYKLCSQKNESQKNEGGAQWCSGKVSVSESRDPWFNPHSQHHVVSLSKVYVLPRVLVNTQEAVAPSRHD